MCTINKFKLTALAVLTGGFLSISSLASAATEVRVAFNQSDSHPQFLALQEFGNKLNEATDGVFSLNN